jgi:acyl carrier protein phosphodiesterase
LNFLAHIFLSGDNPEVKLGNFFGDFVKGSQLDHFPVRVKQGILMHRRIDEFTDNHPVFKESVLLLKPAFGRYAGIMADMYYDHLLAVSFDQYSKLPLRRFACQFYFHALLRYPLLPPRIKRFIFHFVSTNRLVKYASYDGLQASLEIMRTRKSAAIQPEVAIVVLDKHFSELQHQFEAFFPEIMAFAGDELKLMDHPYTIFNDCSGH